MTSTRRISALGDVPGGEPKSRRRLEEDFRNTAERHPEGDIAPKGRNLSPGASMQPGGRHVRVRLQIHAEVKTIPSVDNHIREAVQPSCRSWLSLCMTASEYVGMGPTARPSDVDTSGPDAQSSSSTTTTNYLKDAKYRAARKI